MEDAVASPSLKIVHMSLTPLTFQRPNIRVLYFMFNFVRDGKDSRQDDRRSIFCTDRFTCSAEADASRLVTPEGFKRESGLEGEDTVPNLRALHSVCV